MNRLSIDDLKFLWKRNRAYKLKRPSIDRLDSERDYVLDNCRFIELIQNCKEKYHPKYYKGRCELDIPWWEREEHVKSNQVPPSGTENN